MGGVRRYSDNYKSGLQALVERKLVKVEGTVLTLL